MIRLRISPESSWHYRERRCSWISFAIPHHDVGWDVLGKYFEGFNEKTKEINSRIEEPRETQTGESFIPISGGMSSAIPMSGPDIDTAGRVIIGAPSKIGSTAMRAIRNPVKWFSNLVATGIMKTQEDGTSVITKVDLIN